jgi:hypothetical protein
MTEEKPEYIFYNNKWIPTGFPSWVWDEATEKYIAPLPIPDDRNYTWNEEELTWEEVVND